jgi:hypothetical protein
MTVFSKTGIAQFNTMKERGDREPTFSLDLAKCEVIQTFFLNGPERAITSPRFFQQKKIKFENFEMVVFYSILSISPILRWEQPSSL